MSINSENQPDRDARRAARLENQRNALKFLPAWMEYRKIRQRTLAERIGATEATMSKWLSGVDQMPVGALRQMAVVLQANEADLLRHPDEVPMGERLKALLTEVERLSDDQLALVIQIMRSMKTD